MNLFFGRLRAHLLSGRTIVLVASEFVLIVLSIIAAAAIRMTPEGLMQVMGVGLIWRSALIAAVLQVCLHFCDLYDLRTLSDRRLTVTALLRALGAVSLGLALLYYWVPTLVIGRGVFAIASLLIIFLIAGWRITFNWLSLRLEPAERLLIVGTNAAAVALARELFERRQELAVELVGFVDPDPSKVGMPLLNPGIIGTISDIPTIVRNCRADRVVVSLADARGKLSMDELLRMKLQDGVRFDHLASVYEEYTGKIAVENLRPSWLIFSEGFQRRHAQALAKRLFDVLCATLGLLIAAPIMAIVALAIKLSSDGDALYSQRRVGMDGLDFTIYKFRSMRADAEMQTGAVWSTQNDPRVTRLGRLLRRTRLDELPQLWNVFRGDMSIVGPRPERPEFVSSLTEQIPFYGQRHAVRPGVTGWAQVRHNYGASVEDALQKLQYDLFYIKHMSMTFDLFVLLETIKTVMVRRGS
jgi:sugar transferase (PEP-CTERM system associated)